MANALSTERTQPSIVSPTAAPKRSLVVWIGLAITVLGVIAYNARMGATSPRIANPEVTGVPRPVEFLFGWTGWLVLHQVGTVVMMLLLVAVFVWAWRRHPAHPYLLMVLASTMIVWQDPIMNWAPYAVYNPQLWHWPEDWPLANLSPTVEPFIVIGYSTFYFIGRSSRASGSCAVFRRVRPPTRSFGAARSSAWRCCSSSWGLSWTRSWRSSSSTPGCTSTRK